MTQDKTEWEQYYCSKCEEYFLRPKHKKGQPYHEATHCGQTAKLVKK